MIREPVTKEDAKSLQIMSHERVEASPVTVLVVSPFARSRRPACVCM